MIRRKFKNSHLALVFISAFIIYITYDTITYNKGLKKNGVIVIGKIVSINRDAKTAGVWLDFEYYVDNKKYESSTKTYNLNLRNSNKFINEYFPVMVDIKSPDQCKVLIFENDFKKFKLDYPDSLNWVYN